jgi:hypothetical protein
MPPVEFEPTISAGDRPQTYALDRAAAGIGKVSELVFKKYHVSYLVQIIYRNCFLKM